jgi:hypothetical protein
MNASPLYPSRTRRQAGKDKQQQIDEWASATLLAWLKESGVYDKLNQTLSAGPTVSEELRHKQIQALSILSQLNLLHPAKAADAPVKVASIDAAQLPNVTHTKMPSDLPDFGLSHVLPKLNLSLPHKKAGSAPSKAHPQPDGAAAALTLDQLKSAILLSWLKESGTFDKLAAFNKAIEEVQGEVARAAAHVGNATGGVKAAAVGAAEAVTGKVEVAAGLAIDTASGVHQHIANNVVTPLSGMASDLAGNVSQHITNKVVAPLKDAAAPLQEIGGSIQKVLEGKLKRVTDALAKSIKAVQDIKAAAFAHAQAAAADPTKAADDALSSKLKLANDALAAASAEVDALAKSKLSAADQVHSGFNAIVEQVVAQVQGKLRTANETLSAVGRQAKAHTAALTAPLAAHSEVLQKVVNATAGKSFTPKFSKPVAKP